VAELAGRHGAHLKFPEQLRTLGNEDLVRLGNRYLHGVKILAPNVEHVTDKSVTNFRFVGLIHLALPNARIIHIRRNPVDTCASCFSTLFARGQYFTYNLNELGRYYQAYERLMDHWRTVLPQGVMLEVKYEDLVADLEGEARRMVAHCGLAWDTACLTFYNTQRPVKSASATQVFRPKGNTVTVDPTTQLGLPAGVTLQQIDGGPTYYASNGLTYAANAGWDNPSFFPISPWYSQLVTQTDANVFRAVGWNTVFGLTSSSNLSLADTNGISVVLESALDQGGNCYIDDTAMNKKSSVY
jgi:hypothetical protein